MGALDDYDGALHLYDAFGDLYFIGSRAALTQLRDALNQALRHDRAECYVLSPENLSRFPRSVIVQVIEPLPGKTAATLLPDTVAEAQLPTIFERLGLEDAPDPKGEGGYR